MVENPGAGHSFDIYSDVHLSGRTIEQSMSVPIDIYRYRYGYKRRLGEISNGIIITRTKTQNQNQNNIARAANLTTG